MAPPQWAAVLKMLRLVKVAPASLVAFSTSMPEKTCNATSSRRRETRAVNMRECTCGDDQGDDGRTIPTA